MPLIGSLAHLSPNIDETVIAVHTKFEDLTRQVQVLFKSKEVSPTNMKEYLVRMSSIQSSSDRTVTDVLLKNIDTVDGIFHSIEHFGLWNFINHSLFDDIVAAFLESQPESSQMKTEKKAYEMMLENNILSMCLVDTCQKVRFPLQEVDAQMEDCFNRWTLILQGEYNERGMRFVDNLRHSLASAFEVPLLIILLLNLELTNSSLTITWLIPMCFQTQITTRIQACLQFLEHIGLHIMKIGEKICYEVGHNCMPPHLGKSN